MMGGVGDRVAAAPWTPGQVASLEAFQESEYLEPYRCTSPWCPARNWAPSYEDWLPMAAAGDGLHCIEPGCVSVQKWARADRLDWSWQRGERRARARSERRGRRAFRRMRRHMRIFAGERAFVFTRRDARRLVITLLLAAAIYALAYSPAGHWRLR
jgi:hypothetical protein